MLFGLAPLLIQLEATNPPRPAPVFGPQWTVLDEPVGTVSTLAADPNVSSRLYAGLHDGGPGIQRSDDYGSTWQALEANLRPISIAIDPLSSSRIYVVIEGPEIWRSDDAGTHWTHVPTPPGFLGGPIVDAVGNLYAGNRDGMFQSVDGGQTWTSMSPIPNPNDGYGRDAVVPIAADPFRPGEVYALAQESFIQRLYRTVDGGRSWIGPIWTTGLLEYITSLAVDRDFPQTIYLSRSFHESFISSGSVFSSRDRGGTWQQILMTTDAGAMVSDPARPGTIYLSVPTTAFAPSAIFRWTAGRMTPLGNIYFFVSKLAISADGSFLYAIDEKGRAARLSLVSSPRRVPRVLPQR